eukprot:5156034-Pleurochrysis_carterae.AAC.1
MRIRSRSCCASRSLISARTVPDCFGESTSEANGPAVAQGESSPRTVEGCTRNQHPGSGHRRGYNSAVPCRTPLRTSVQLAGPVSAVFSAPLRSECPTEI